MKKEIFVPGFDRDGEDHDTKNSKRNPYSFFSGAGGGKKHLDSGTLAPFLKRLEKRRILQRIRPKDNERKLFLSLTEQGEALKEKAKAVPAAMQGCIPLEREELMLLKSLLDQALIRMNKQE